MGSSQGHGEGVLTGAMVTSSLQEYEQHASSYISEENSLSESLTLLDILQTISC